MRLLATSSAAAGLGIHGAWVEPRRLQVTRHVVGTPGAGRAAMTVVQLSDLHLKHLGDFHRRIARAVADARPDLVLVTGDALDRGDALPLLDRFLSTLDPATPTLAIPGNWEHWSGADLREIAATYARWNARLLVNESVVLRHRGRPLLVTGLDDLVGGRPDVAAALRGVVPGPTHLLLAHCPAHRDRLAETAGEVRVGDQVLRQATELAAYPFAAMLAGHTHGGQFTVGGWAPVLPPGSGRYTRGWFRDAEGPPLFVSRGLGTSVIPARLGATPELAVFTVWV